MVLYRRRRAYRRRTYRRPSVRRTARPVYRRRRTYRRRSAPAMPVPAKVTGTSHGDKYVMALADPFDENVDGVKVPDANSQPSVPLKADDTIDVVVGGVNSCSAWAFNPSFAGNAVSHGGTAGSTSWTWAGAFGGVLDSSKLPQLRTDFEMFRPVSHAIRITSGLAPTAAKGFVHVCVFSQALYNQTTWQYPTNISLMQNVPGYKRIPIGRLTAEGLTVVNRPLDVTSQRYIDTDSPVYGNAGTMEFQSGLQWCSIVVAVTGVELNTTPVTVESILHAECIPRATAISQATPAAKYNVNALGAGSNVASKTNPSALDSEKTERKNNAFKNAFGFLQTAGAGMRSPSFQAALGKMRNAEDLKLSSRLSNAGIPSFSMGGIRNSAPSSKSSGMWV